MKLKNQIELLNDTLKLHDEKVDKHFPTDEKKIPAYAKAQYIDLFRTLQNLVEAYEAGSFSLKLQEKLLKFLLPT